MVYRFDSSPRFLPLCLQIVGGAWRILVPPHGARGDTESFTDGAARHSISSKSLNGLVLKLTDILSRNCSSSCLQGYSSFSRYPVPPL